MSVSDYPDWSAPQAQASAIAATGVPLLTQPSGLTGISKNIAANASASIGPLAVSQPSYEITFTASESGAGSAGPLQVIMYWYDPTASVMIATEYWYIWPGAGGIGHSIVGKGPTKGAQLLVTFENTSSAMSYSVTGNIYLRSHIYTRDDWRSVSYNATASGISLASSDMPALLIGGVSLNEPAAGVLNYELPLYSGPAFLHADTASGTNDFRVIVQNSADPNGVGMGSEIARFQSDSNGMINSAVSMPRFQCRLQVLNMNASARIINAVLVATDGAS